MRSRVACLIVIFACALFVGGAMKVSQAYEGPLSEKKIASYSNIAFSPENFQNVQKGMTQEEVLQLLGKPLRTKKEHRRHNRWTVHYFYPDGRVVNFKDGLVGGKSDTMKWGGALVC